MIEVNDRYQMDVDKLKEKIQQDRQEGLTPLCVIATCGTVNTGACDDLEAVSKICKQEKLWFHLDGAFGALAYFSPKYRSYAEGIKYADSMAFDLHKWLSMPYEVGCILVKDGNKQLETFSSTSPATYIDSTTRGVLNGPLVFADLGVELTRGFKALKVWMSMKAHGVKTYRELITQNIDQVVQLEELVDKHDKLQNVAPRDLNILCFRYFDRTLSEDQLTKINAEIIVLLQEEGSAVISHTVLGGKYCLRVANVNQRSQQDDFDHLVNRVAAIGDDLALKY